MARPKQPILSQDLIRDQALAIIDEDGLGALTMRRLAKRLDVQAASLYTHFPNKEAVLAAITVRLTKRVDTSAFAQSWQEGLHTWADSYYTAIHWHPHAAPIVAGRDGVDVAVDERVRAGLVNQGWTPSEAALAADAVKFLVLGAAAATGWSEPADPSGSTEARHAEPASRIDANAASLNRASFDYALDRLLEALEADHAARSVQGKLPAAVSR